MKGLELTLLALRLAVELVRWVERQDALSDAARELLRQLKETTDASIEKASAARARVRAELDAHPERLRDTDDGFRRD